MLPSRGSDCDVMTRNAVDHFLLQRFGNLSLESESACRSSDREVRIDDC